MKRLLPILALLLTVTLLFAASDIAPHSLSGYTSGVYTVAASSEFGAGFEAYKAFDLTVSFGHYWIANGATGWLRMRINDGNLYTLHDYSVQVNTIGEPNRAPKDWTMEGSTDGSAWVTLDTVTNSTAWGSGEIRNFVCDTIAGGYSYFRLNVSANNGDGLLQTGELFLYADVYTPPSAHPRFSATIQ